jgi:hypothetical protein
MSRRSPDAGRRRSRRPAFPITSRSAVAVRRAVARHRWWYRAAVLATAVGAAATTLDRLDSVDAARAEWGRTRDVLVATSAAAAGDPLTVEVRAVPAAVVPAAAVDPADGAERLVARQRVTAGEIVTEADVAPDGPLGLVPRGWVAVAVVESPPSGAAPGERVQLASDGMIINDTAVVVGHTDDATLVAVPEAGAALVPLAAATGSLALLRVP